MGWVSGVERWPPTDQIIAWARNRPTRPQQRQELLRDVRSSDVAFVGDSITFDGLWSEYFHTGISVANRGFPGATTGDLLSLLPVITATRAKLYFVMAGLNDILNTPLGHMQTASNLLILRKHLLSSQPGVKVIIQSTLECLSPQCSAQVLTKIRRINKQLEKSLPLGSYLNINYALSSSYGLRQAYTYDGFHLNAKGYAKWRKILEPKLLNE